MSDINNIKQYQGWYLPNNRPIDKLINNLIIDDQDGKLLGKIENRLKIILQSIIMSADYDKSYCMNFKIPIEQIYKLTDIHPSIPEKEILLIHLTDSWVSSKGEKYERGESKAMREDFVYIILEFITLYSLRRLQDKYPHKGDFSTDGLYTRKETSGNNPVAQNPVARLCLFIILLRIWNGQLKKFFTTKCDASIMKYVVSVKMNKNYHARKHETPLQLIKKEYLEGEGNKTSIPKTYFFRMFLDSTHSIQMVEASWKRIRQLFGSSKRENIKHGKSEGNKSGFAPLYYDAVKNNERFSKMLNNDGENVEIEDNYADSDFVADIESLTNEIIMKTKEPYPTEFKDFIKNNVKNISFNKLNEITNIIHDINKSEEIKSLLQAIFSRLSNVSKEQICVKTFFKLHIKKAIISSKHHEDVIEIKKICEDLLIDYFKKNKNINFNEWSNTQKSQYISIILYTIGFNIQQYFCEN